MSRLNNIIQAVRDTPGVHYLKISMGANWSVSIEPVPKYHAPVVGDLGTDPEASLITYIHVALAEWKDAQEDEARLAKREA